MARFVVCSGMSPDPTSETPEQAALVNELARRYLWWEPIGDRPHGFTRAVAQIMNLGTYEDIRRLEHRIDRDRLIDVMRGAQPGWFSERSWSFWRGRLSVSSVSDIPETPPRRRFVDAAIV